MHPMILALIRRIPAQKTATVLLAAFLGTSTISSSAIAAQNNPGPGSTYPKNPGQTAPGAQAPRAGSGLGSTTDQGLAREQMWYAPTAEDWKKPCLITFQRTWDDAVAVARETGRLVLVCVNMDGEIASEHYAGVRYRDPAVAKLYEPYVCVIASTYRHNPRDYDEQGRRVLCPRFGSVTCGEHIWIEPVLYEKFLDGRRIAPRHIAVDIQKADAELYDVFYAFDTASVLSKIETTILERPPVPPIIENDRPVLDRVESHDVRDRVRVESAYVSGTAAERRALLSRAVTRREKAPTEVLRLALFDLDRDLVALARKSLTDASSEASIDLILEALRVPMDASERDALVASLVRIGENSPRARTLAAVFRGLSATASQVDLAQWNQALVNAPALPRGRDDLERRLDEASRVAAERADDAGAHLAVAEACLALGADAKSPRKYARVLFEDAQRAVREAETLGASGPRLAAAQALSAYYSGDSRSAHARADAAAQGFPAEPLNWNAMSTLALFAEARQSAIQRAVREKKDWPSQWMTDVHVAYSVIARHPFGTDAHVVVHYDFLRYLGALAAAERAIDEGIARFPGSWTLHDRLRTRILKEKGIEGLEAVYADMLRAPGASRNLEEFAGYAALVAAEFQRREGNVTKALASYGRGIAHYEKFVEANPDDHDNADHFIAMAFGARARLAYERGDDAGALAELQLSFERKPDAAATLDGLNISAVDTAKMLRARLTDQKREDLLAPLQAAIDRLDPELLQLPAYEREPAPERPQGGANRPPRGG